MINRWLALLAVVALAGTLMPPASCMGLAQGCCCGGGGKGEPGAGDLLSADGCGCRGPQLRSCTPDPSLATSPSPRTALLAPEATVLASTGAGSGPPLPGTGLLAPLSPPTEIDPSPQLALLCSLRL